ncbi:MAG TPA: hypothetical protein VG457_00135 [Planctomycetota bacterium]|nr:hypothetical protein [Planctomycetota bacterium]
MIMAQREYLIEAIEVGRSHVRKPRQWLGLTLRRLDDGRRLHVKLRCIGKVGQTVRLDDETMAVGLWKS